MLIVFNYIICNVLGRLRISNPDEMMISDWAGSIFVTNNFNFFQFLFRMFKLIHVSHRVKIFLVRHLARAHRRIQWMQMHQVQVDSSSHSNNSIGQNQPQQQHICKIPCRIRQHACKMPHACRIPKHLQLMCPHLKRPHRQIINHRMIYEKNRHRPIMIYGLVDHQLVKRININRQPQRQFVRLHQHLHRRRRHHQRLHRLQLHHHQHRHRRRQQQQRRWQQLLPHIL